ncbi:MAG: uracil-DNA glycosylase family protein [Bacteroidota bacterium]
MLNSSEVKFQTLLRYIESCDICSNSLPDLPKQVVQLSEKSKILIIGKSPSEEARNSGILWNNRGGEKLRSWLGVTDDQFYDPDNFALLPMGFCYPGKANHRDLPPRPECAPLWHNLLVHSLNNIELTVLVGEYAQSFYLNGRSRESLFDNVKAFKEYLPEYFILPYPKTQFGLTNEPAEWLDKEVFPELKTRVKRILG